MLKLAKTVYIPLDRKDFSVRFGLTIACLIPFLLILGRINDVLRLFGIKGELASVFGVMALIYTLSVVGLILVACLYFMLRRMNDLVEDRYNIFVSLVVLLAICNILPNGPVLAALTLLLTPGKKYFEYFNAENLTLQMIVKGVDKLKEYLMELRNKLNDFRLRFSHLR